MMNGYMNDGVGEWFMKRCIMRAWHILVIHEVMVVDSDSGDGDY